MKQSDIEEYKAIGYLFIGVLAYHWNIIIIAVLAWVLASISFLTGCVIAYYEQKIKKLKHTLRMDSQ
jgi:hypothetical protein